MLSVLISILSATLCLAGCPSSIIRPCRLTDYRCLQNNFAVNSNCNRKVTGSVPEEFVVDKFVFHTPFYNATFIEDNLIVRNNHRCFLTEFFFNTAANTALISADCPGLLLLGRRTLLHHQSRQEDQTYQFYVTVSYPLVRLTMHIKNATAFDVCSSFTYGEVAALPSFTVTPLDAASANHMPPDSTWPVYERENWLDRARPLMRYIINSLICDFGCR